MTYEYLNDTHMTYIYVSTYRGDTYWQYIVFDYNEKYLEDCKKYSKLLKIDMQILYSQRSKKGKGDFTYE